MKLGPIIKKIMLAGIMKKITAGHFLFLIGLLIILTGACNKKINPFPDGNGGDSTDDGDSTIIIDDSGIVPKDYNIFGIYPGPSASEDLIAYTGNPKFQYDLTNARGISLARAYGSKYFRLHVSHDRWSTDTGKTNFIGFMKKVSDSGMQAVLNVNWNETDQTPDPFPKGSDYAIFLKEVLDSLNANFLKPTVIVVENEPANFNNHLIDTSSNESIDADVKKYIDQLAAAIPVCKSFFLVGWYQRCKNYRWWFYG